jgi:hypothetical protein
LASQLLQPPISWHVRSRRPFDVVFQRLVLTRWLVAPCPGSPVLAPVATVVAAMGVLFTLWLATDLARPLVYACWWGFCLLAAWLVTVLALTAHRSLRTAS